MAEPTDPLAPLRRQRALVAEHLAWLDAEIRRLSPAISTTTPPDTLPPGPPVTAAPQGSPPPSTPAPDAATLANARADEILARYAVEDRFDPNRTRRGCLLLFSAVLALGFAALVALYHFGYQHRP